MAALLVHHDALRLRFRREAGGWRQWHAAPQPAPQPAPQADHAPGARIDLSALPEWRTTAAVTAAVTAAQGSLDLAAGPLLRALWLDLPAGQARLFLAVHHLAVDGVSWRVILDDLATAWRQVGRGEPVALPPKTASFQGWAERLAALARTMAVEPELSFWLAQSAPGADGGADTAGELALDRPLDRSDGGDTVAAAETVAIELAAEETAELLRALPAAYGASIAEALIAALAWALAGPGAAARIDLEGHGREEVSGESLDLSRTVGWFTSLYPVLLAPGDDPRPGAVLAAVRRQLAAVPGRGIGYGLLRYLSDDPAAASLRGRPPSPVSFNYLGQLDAVLPAASPFAPAGEPSGPVQSPRARRSHPLAVLAFVAAGRLQVAWSYGAGRFQRAAIERLAGRFAAHLRELAAHARAVAEGREPRVGGAVRQVPGDFPEAVHEVPGDFPSRQVPGDSPGKVPGDSPRQVPGDFLREVPGDFPADGLAGVDAATLARLPADLEDLYPLAPLQEGVLFHSLFSPGSGEYVEQLRASFEGDLDLAAFREAWRRIVARTPVLRTSFHFLGSGADRPALRRRRSRRSIAGSNSPSSRRTGEGPAGRRSSAASPSWWAPTAPAASISSGRRSCAGSSSARASAPGASSGAITTRSSTAGPTRR